MKSGIVGALFMMFATFGPASAKASPDPNPQGKKGDARSVKAATITPVKPTPTPPVCGSRGESGAHHHRCGHSRPRLHLRQGNSKLGLHAYARPLWRLGNWPLSHEPCA